MSIRTETTIAGVRALLRERRARGERIALVPTMGYLHEGHLSLVDRARGSADYVVMSIFVNPLQFGPREDLATYPRDLPRDTALAAERGVDLLFVPENHEMYPLGEPLVRLAAPALTSQLCGKFRPGHFDGVLTVVAKLFNIVQPDTAVFGQKDYQQTVVLRRLVSDYDLPITIEVAPITREADGLAMSSRNVYLEPEQRVAALALSRALNTAAALFRTGERASAALLAAARKILDAEPGVQLQYLDLVEPDLLQPIERAQAGSVIAVAAYVGRTRLIDNVILGV